MASMVGKGKERMGARGWWAGGGTDKLIDLSLLIL